MAEERVRRRLAAILAADVAGYSRLMGEDEAGTLARIKTLRRELLDPKVVEYGGRIVKTMGDGLLVEFPSAVDAVQHAVDVQRAMAERNRTVQESRRIEIRIGINLGDVIVDGDDLYGDGINVAARLEDLATPGGICISDSAYGTVVGKLEAAFEDQGERDLKNIARPVRVWRWVRADGATELEALGAAPPLPDKPSVAVMPFTNMSGDADQEYFADGMTEDLITDLSKLSGLFVIARNSSFAYKGQSPDLRRVGRELGVRHVLEGSVRKAANRVRINAQLIDAESGRHLWAERYDGDLEDIFDLQDQITAKIVSALEVTLTTGDRTRADRIPTEDMAAYDLFLRGRAAIFPPSKANNARARELLEEAVQRDTAFADAYALLGYVYLLGWVFLWAEEPGIDKALETAEKAVGLDDGLALAHARLGWISCARGDFDRAVAELERAIALDPNDADSHHWLGEALNYMGMPEKGLEATKRAMRLSPHLHGAHLGHGYYLLRRYDEATVALTEGKARAPSFPIHCMLLAAVHAELGRLEDARTEIENLLRIVPGLDMRIMRERFVRYRNPSDRDRLFGALRKAGMPEGA